MIINRVENKLTINFRFAYNFTAHTNGPYIYRADVPNELTPTRGVVNNNRELLWMETDLAAQIPNTKAVLYVAVNDFLLHMDYKDCYNHIGRDPANRIDQFVRSAATFSVLELSNITNPKRPFPQDCENAHFQDNRKKGFDSAYFRIDDKEVTMKMLDEMCRHVSNA